MQKNWQLLTKANTKFIKQHPEYSEVVLQLLANRQLKENEEIEAFFSQNYEQLIYSPFLFRDMEAAVNLIIKHVKEQNLIYIYGDYDADGVTATALLYDVLALFKAKVNVYLPDRVAEGYGLNKAAVDLINKDGAKLIVTVDCGIRDKERVEYAKKLGIEVVVTDHHMPPENKNDNPQCLIINAQLHNEKYPDKNLPGVAVSFKLAEALIRKSNLGEDKKEKIIESLLDLVAIGTITDIVSLLGENRALVKKGLEVLNKTKRKGLFELIKVANLNNNRNLDAWNISFQLGPRINAAGRMDHANAAFKLLTTKDKDEAATLANNLDEKNKDRQRLTDEIFLEVDRQVLEQKGKKVIVGVCQVEDDEAADIWNEGVIGLVAGKICEKYYLPTLVITKTEDGYKGSGRSIPELDLIKIIEQSAEFLDKYGGHPGACGFTLKKSNFKNFTKKVRELAEKELAKVDLQPKTIIDCELNLNQINLDLAQDVEKFAPFGRDNERPKFVTYNVKIADIINMGLNAQHVKLKLKADNPKVFNAIGFGQADKWNHLRIGDTIDIVYYIEINEFNGYRDVQLKILDIKKHE